jgi:superfamily II DNA/RNA helicase
MIGMFEANKVIIAPEFNVKELQSKGLEIDEIIEHIAQKGYEKDDFVFDTDDFDDEFVRMLHNDKDVLQTLCDKWDKIEEDPKLDLFISQLERIMHEDINPEKKLVVFSESVDTITYLYKYLTEKLGRKDVMNVTAASRNRLFNVIKSNFDANVPKEKQENRYSIILTTDVLAEGINLHRSNMIVNYDSPWNASRLMQRIGRVNRIGSVAESIYNYMFYPSQQGDKEIKLYKNALIKLQGFHSALGEDAQIYSREEIVKDFKLFDSNVKDVVDKKISLLRELRNLYNSNRELYHKIKELPLKSRVFRNTGKHHGTSIIFVSTKIKTEFYIVKEDKKPVQIDFLNAVTYLKAKPQEVSVITADDELHFAHVNAAVNKFHAELVNQTDKDSIKTSGLDKTTQTAEAFLRKIKQICEDEKLRSDCQILHGLLEQGTFSKLPKTLKTISQEYKGDRIKIKEDTYTLQGRIGELVKEYHNEMRADDEDIVIGTPKIIISETFI